jgi:hypothetical protein
MSNGQSIAGLRPGIASSDLLAPLVIRSSSAAVRVGNYGPSLLMNIDAQATIWVARDGSVRTDYGVPIPAGQSVPWVGGELWAILGSDTLSAGRTPTLVVTTYVHDWTNQAAIATAVLNSGTLLIDQPVLIQAGAMGGAATIGPFAVSTYQTVHLNTSPANVAGTPRVLTLTWQDSSGNTLATDVYRWSTTPDTSAVVEALPVRGSQLTITTSGGGANTQSVILTGSHRAWSPLMRSVGDRVLGTGTNAALATAGTLSFTLVRYDGPVSITVDAAGAGAAQSVFASIRDLVNNMIVVVQRDSGFVDSGTSRNEFTVKGVLPRNTCQAQVTNLSGANLSVNAIAIAAPEGT